MSFEKVIAAFSDYLLEDHRCEIVSTSRGYAVLEWDSTQHEWLEARHCPTPERMHEVLLGAYTSFLEYQITGGNRPLSEDERTEINRKRQLMEQKVNQAKPM